MVQVVEDSDVNTFLVFKTVTELDMIKSLCTDNIASYLLNLSLIALNSRLWLM